MSLFWNWVPLVSVGPIVFGEIAQPVLEEYGFLLEEAYDELLNWTSYQAPVGETSVSVEEGRFVSVHCYDELFYEGQNLLGLRVEELREILGREDEFDREYPQAIYYEDLGGTFWVEQDDETWESHNIIEAATCNGPIEEDE